MRARRGRYVETQDAQTIAPRILTTDELTHAQLPPELAQTWYQEDWVKGIGGQSHRLHPKALASALKVDASEEGVLKLARDITATTVDTAPDAYKPSGFATYGNEVWVLQPPRILEVSGGRS